MSDTGSANEAHQRLDALTDTVGKIGADLASLASTVDSFIKQSVSDRERLTHDIRTSREPWAQYLTMIGGGVGFVALLLGYILTLHNEMSKMRDDAQGDAIVSLHKRDDELAVYISEAARNHDATIQRLTKVEGLADEHARSIVHLFDAREHDERREQSRADAGYEDQIKEMRFQIRQLQQGFQRKFAGDFPPLPPDP